MILPTIHLNGSAAADLAAGYREAYSAIGDAIRAVKNTAPNGRDYPKGQGELFEAIIEHDERISSLARIQQDLLDLHEACNP